VNAVGATPAASMRARSARASATRPARAREAMRALKRDAEGGGVGPEGGIPSGGRAAGAAWGRMPEGVRPGGSARSAGGVLNEPCRLIWAARRDGVNDGPSRAAPGSAIWWAWSDFAFRKLFLESREGVLERRAAVVEQAVVEVEFTIVEGGRIQPALGGLCGG
jgi:hypothetical protein